MQCSICGHDIVEGVEYCGNCGAKLVEPASPALQNQNNIVTAPPVVMPQTPPETLQQNQVTPTPATVAIAQSAPATAVAVPKSQRKGFSVVSMILGIGSILAFLLWFISIPLAIAAIIFGLVGMARGGKGMAVAGIATAFVGVLFTVLAIFLFLNFCNNNSDDPLCESTNGAYLLIFGR